MAPVPTPLTQPFWDACARGELHVQQCATCARSFFPPCRFCPYCLSADVRWRAASGRARLYSYLIQHRAAPGFTPADVPYAVAIVELDEGPRMMTNIVGIPSTPEALELDMPLQVRFVERGPIALPVFGPVTEGTGR
jgi:uncharacterized OB-fold protein